jgi:hypothetical protein
VTCPDCEYNKARAANWRAEAYKLIGHDYIPRLWVGLTEKEQVEIAEKCGCMSADWLDFAQAIEKALKEKNHE